MRQNEVHPPARFAPESGHAPDASAVEGKQPRKALVGLIVAVGALALLVIAGAVTVAVVNQGRTAQATAEQYFAALAAGDATTANSLTSASDTEVRDTALLTDEILGAATERISDISVTPADDPLDTFDQTVDVSYTLAGEQYAHTLVLARGEPEWFFFNSWQMRSSFASNIVFTMRGTGTFTIAGAPIVAESPAARLFPAVYPVAAADSIYFELENDELVIDGVENTPTVAFVPTVALAAEVQEQVNEQIDLCAELTVTSTDSTRRSDGCSLYVVLAQAGNIAGTWEIIEYPTVKLSLGGAIYETDGGRARFAPADGSESAEMIRGIELSGTVEVSGGEVSLIPWGAP